MQSTLHVTHFLRSPIYTQQTVDWRKALKKHISPRLLRLQENSHCANFFVYSPFHVRLFLRNPNLTKKGCCLAKNSQKSIFCRVTQETTKNFTRRGQFSTEQIGMLHTFLKPKRQKWLLPGRKKSKKNNLPQEIRQQ